jgi:hypothetical protein
METMSDVDSINSIYPVNAVLESRNIRSIMANMEQGNSSMLQFEYWQNRPTITVNKDMEPNRK